MKELELHGKVKYVRQLTYMLDTTAMQNLRDIPAGLLPNEDVRYTFDLHGNLTGKVEYGLSGMLSQKKYVYSPNGRQIHEEDTYADGSTHTYRIDLVYDPQGRKVDEKVFDGDTQTEHRTYVYDRQGCLTEENHDDHLRFISTYDEKGNLTERVTEIMKARMHVRTFTSDGAGNIRSMQWYRAEDKSTQTYRYEYEFDPAGNWITKRFYKNGVLYCIRKREIEYYP